MPYSFCFSVFPVPSLGADGFYDKALLYLFLICRAAMLASPDNLCLFYTAWISFSDCQSIALFCNSLLSYRDHIPFKADKRKYILLVLFDA